MPEFSLALISEVGFGLLAGLVLGWIFRAARVAREKQLVNAGWQEQLNVQYDEIERLREQNAQLLEQVQQHKHAYKDLTERLESASSGEEHAQAKLVDANKSNEALHERLSTLSKALEAAEQKAKDQAAELLAWQSRIAPLVNKYRERVAQVHHLEQELKQIRRDLGSPPEPSESPADEADAGLEEDAKTLDMENLQLIRGVGPAIEKTLQKLGIRNLEQIAELTAEDIHRVAAEIRGFSSRIARENWIGQARKMLGRK
jgi:predicted flap endonuclease-1-like 5' DNA nuclease